MKKGSRRFPAAAAGIAVLLLALVLVLLLPRITDRAEEKELPQETDADMTGEGELPAPVEQAGAEAPEPETETEKTPPESGGTAAEPGTPQLGTRKGTLPGPATEAAQAPDGAGSTFPAPGQVFDIIDGQVVWLSITEEEFIAISSFLRDLLGVNDAALAGVMANLQGESGFDPNKIGDMGGAYGICQWRGPRLDQMVEYCEKNDLNPVSLEGQLRFLAHDLKEVYIYAYDQIRLCEDSESGAVQATYNFCAYYEVPSDPEEESKEREELTKLLIYPKLNELSEAKETGGMQPAAAGETRPGETEA